MFDNARKEIVIIFCVLMLSVSIYASVKYYADSDVWYITSNNNNVIYIMHNRQTGASYIFRNDKTDDKFKWMPLERK